MSQHAVQAVLAAAAQDPNVKKQLLDAKAQKSAMVDVLSLSQAEVDQILGILSNPDQAAVAETPVDERNVPGPGVGGGRLFR